MKFKDYISSCACTLAVVACAQTPGDIRSARSAGPNSAVKVESSADGSAGSIESEAPQTINLNANFSSDVLKLHQNTDGESSFTLNSDQDYSGMVAVSLSANQTDFTVSLMGKDLSEEPQLFSFADLKSNKLDIKHKPVISGNEITFTDAGMAPPFKVIFSGEGIEGTEADVKLELSAVAVVTANDPASNGGKMLSQQMINLTEGTGLCILNNYKDGLRLHGVPHQGGGGMGMGACYDKYGGDNKSLTTLDSVMPCSTTGSDVMYDHDAGNIESLRLTVRCDPK
jgi:hypothetical protein